jgi:hypothetical protein
MAVLTSAQRIILENTVIKARKSAINAGGDKIDGAKLSAVTCYNNMVTKVSTKLYANKKPPT